MNDILGSQINNDKSCEKFGVARDVKYVYNIISELNISVCEVSGCGQDDQGLIPGRDIQTPGPYSRTNYL